MARRKEWDLDERNKTRITEISRNLFEKQGYEKTQMNDIAKAAQISKSTLYVYFKSKEEIKDYLSLRAMHYFYEALCSQVNPESPDLHEKYLAICNVLVDFKQTYPLSFQLIMDEIDVSEAQLNENKILAEIYTLGEQINQYICNCFTERTATETSSVSKDAFFMIMEHWASLYGVITLAENKEAYLLKNFGITKEAFLKSSFEDLFSAMNRRNLLV